MVLPVLAVSDMERSLDYYTGRLGWTKLFGMPGPTGGEVFAMVKMNDQVMFGLSAQPAPEPRGSGVVLMAYVADGVDIDSYYKECQARGTVIERGIRDEYWGDRCFSCKDPDGYWIEITKTVRQVTAEEAIAAAQPSQ